MPRTIGTKRINILVIAHYEPEGKLRFDTLRAIIAAGDFFDKIYLVSTNLLDAEADKIPESVSWSRRENYGYDFYSYREGILAAYTEFDFQSEIASLTLMNTSFLITDAVAFFTRLTLNFNEVGCGVVGATKSFEHGEHLQSYLLTFSPEVLMNENFIDWWHNMRPISDKNLVILNYEIGLSVLLKNLGFSLHAPIMGNSLRNPSHEYYAELLDLLGIIKFELINKNPTRVSLHYLITRICKDNDVRNTIFKSLQYNNKFLVLKLRARLFIIRKIGKFISRQTI